jgi:CheY-like chemotaxis protein
VLRLLRFLLVGSGYACLEARSAEEALELAAMPRRIDVLLVDADLPGAATPALVLGLRELSPHARLVFMASSFQGVARTAEEDTEDPSVVPKPVTSGVLLRAIRDALSRGKA